MKEWEADIDSIATELENLEIRERSITDELARISKRRSQLIVQLTSDSKPPADQRFDCDNNLLAVGNQVAFARKGKFNKNSERLSVGSVSKFHKTLVEIYYTNSEGKPDFCKRAPHNIIRRFQPS